MLGGCSEGSPRGADSGEGVEWRLILFLGKGQRERKREKEAPATRPSSPLLAPRGAGVAVATSSYLSRGWTGLGTIYGGNPHGGGGSGGDGGMHTMLARGLREPRGKRIAALTLFLSRPSPRPRISAPRVLARTRTRPHWRGFARRDL